MEDPTLETKEETKSAETVKTDRDIAPPPEAIEEAELIKVESEKEKAESTRTIPLSEALPLISGEKLETKSEPKVSNRS